MKIKKIFSTVIATVFLGAALGGCSSNSDSGAGTNDSGTTAATQGNSANAASSDEVVVLKGLADLTPHNELIEFVKPQLAAQGIEVDIVSTASDATWNEKVLTGEVDFNFNQHEPYLIEWNEINDGNLVNAGDIHVEPIAAYSNRWNSVDEVPDNASVIIPNDATNEYRALRILEQAGFIKLAETENVRASVLDIEEYIKPIDIVEMDSIQIISHADEFDIYIVNTNKALEAGLDTTKYLFREGSDSPYANIIATTPEKAESREIKALVAALQSKETADYIEENYNGAVIPVFPNGNSANNISAAEAEDDTDYEPVTILGLADLTPHNELIDFVKPQLEAQGITVNIVSTASDSTWNEKVQVGEIDFNFFQHEPYLLEWDEINDGNLVNAGDIHVEPIAAYSNRWNSVDEVPDNAKVIIPNDATNEYRALLILEKAGFIKLADVENVRASVLDIEEYIKPLDIVEMDSIQIISHADEFDIYIVNTNKALEAGLDTTKYLFREGNDSPYANIIATTPEKAESRAIKALVAALQSAETAQYIEDHYNGAVIPVFPAN